ncbi:MAG: ATP-binding protein [Mucilaginibacter sp.]
MQNYSPEPPSLNQSIDEKFFPLLKTEHAENILERITDGFTALDNNFCYTYANKKIGEMLGCAPESLIGRNVSEVFPKAVGSHPHKAFNAAMRKQQYICHQDYYAPLNLWQEHHIYPSSSGLSVFTRNITEKKMAELEQEKITADLVRRNNDLEQFTYIISHNLRSPVANIKGLSDLLNCFDHTDPDCVTTLDSLALSVKNLDKVIMDLNQILQTGNQVNDKNEAVSLPVLIAEIKSGLQDMIAASNVAIYCDFNWIDELYILKSYIHSIFQNLVVNSIKYRRAEVDPIIQISTLLKKDKVVISFKDNGKGIDLDRNGKQLFGLYKRFDNSVEGKGMGLFMVKMQVESLGGTISVDSELGKGTEFKITLAMEKSNR